MLRLILVCIVVLFLHQAFAQAPYREFRGVWVATVKNIDWPSRPGLSSEQQKQELKNIIDIHHQQGMNAIILQVRAAGDAFYYSPFEPWSEWLSGKEGEGPESFYDPLTYAIELCKERGMELHAWVNPFRAKVNFNHHSFIASNHIYARQPEWTLQYGNNLYLDPGIPEVRAYLVGLILDLVARYEIDAIHMDDYFYPYRIANEDFPDSNSYQLYRGFMNDKEEWRRENINQFIFDLRTKMKRIKPEVKLGISPFGVWRNREDDPLGSDTKAGQTSYDDLYADVRKWLMMNWIDYVAPQIYWSIGYPLASYDVLVEWWANNSFGKHLYIGKAAYKINNNQDDRWMDPGQMPSQIRLDRTKDNIHGSIFFNSKSLINNPLSISDSLIENYYKSPAIGPSMDWMGLIPPPEPQNAQTAVMNNGILIHWELSEKASSYALYRGYSKRKPSPSMELSLYKIISLDQLSYFIDSSPDQKGYYVYRLTALSRNYRESLPSNTLVQKLKSKDIAKFKSNRP